MWWLAIFEVEKQDHAILKVFFNLTEIPKVIRRQISGEVLRKDDGYGDLHVK